MSYLLVVLAVAALLATAAQGFWPQPDRIRYRVGRPPRT